MGSILFIFKAFLNKETKILFVCKASEPPLKITAFPDLKHRLDISDATLILATMSQNSNMKASEELADIIQQNLDTRLTSKNRGVKQAGFHVLVGASMPNVLIEVGFLSNESEARNLSKHQYRKKIATAGFSKKCCRSYLNCTKNR